MMNSHNHKDFTWDQFEIVFSTPNIMYSQGEYKTLVDQILNQLPDINDKIKLINLLDLRLITLLEIADGCPNSSYECHSGELIFNDTLLARLQINDDFAQSLGFPRKRSDRLVNISALN